VGGEGWSKVQKKKKKKTNPGSMAYGGEKRGKKKKGKRALQHSDPISKGEGEHTLLPGRTKKVYEKKGKDGHKSPSTKKERERKAFKSPKLEEEGEKEKLILIHLYH